MRKIILDLAVTQDGFIEGPNGEIDWCIMEDEPDFQNSDFGQFLQSVDTIFYGRISYELWGNYEPDENANAAVRAIFNSVHKKTKFVFSRTTRNADGKATFLHSNILERVVEIKRQGGKDIWLYGGGSLITTFINMGLVDGYRLSVHPLILGAGKPLFQDIRQKTNLKLVNVKPAKSGVVLMNYEKMFPV